MGLSFGSLTGKILISSDKKKKKIELLSNELEYNPNLPIVSHSDFRIWACSHLENDGRTPLVRRAFGTYVGDFDFLCLIFFPSLPDLISCSALCITLAKMSLLCPALTDSRVLTDTDTHTKMHISDKSQRLGGKK